MRTGTGNMPKFASELRAEIPGGMVGGVGDLRRYWKGGIGLVPVLCKVIRR